MERVQGKLFNIFLKEQIFTPLGINSTSSHPVKNVLSISIFIYVFIEHDGKIVHEDDDHLYYLTDSGNFFSTVEDLFRFDLATLAKAFKPTKFYSNTLSRYQFI